MLCVKSARIGSNVEGFHCFFSGCTGCDFAFGGLGEDFLFLAEPELGGDRLVDEPEVSIWPFASSFL